MRIKALVIRILKQFIRDKRTLALMIVAPIFILTLVNLVFNGEDYEPTIGFVDVPAPILSAFEELDNVATKTFSDKDIAEINLKDRTIDGVIVFEEGNPHIYLEGSDPTVSGTTIKLIQKVLQQTTDSSSNIDIHTLYGSMEMKQFDSFGPVLLGFFAFFFVFLVAGVSFLRERTSGTLERLLSSPVRRWEIVVSYIIGFGLFTMVQSSIIVFYAVYVLGMINEGSIFYVLLTILMLSFVALTLGILLSTFAKNELQMIQFIPIIVVPQVFFSGLFQLDTISSWISWLSTITPLYYAANALKDVMIRGNGFIEIVLPLCILLGFSVVFMLINILSLKKYRKI